MKRLGIIWICLLCLGFLPADAQQADREILLKAWPAVVVKQAATAVNASYMTAAEQDVILWVNLARLRPRSFAALVLQKEQVTDPAALSTDARELYHELWKKEPLPVLQPARSMFDLALCWAWESGQKGLVGHDRKSCKYGYNGECCMYGPQDPFQVVLSLLIDKGVPSRGHRRILLGNYGCIGVSLQPHKSWGYVTVLDLATGCPATGQ